MSDVARLKWNCRRGMKELDLLLEHYLEHDYQEALKEEQAAFRAILDLDDPVIWYYVMEREWPTDEAQQIVIRKFINTLQHRV